MIKSKELVWNRYDKILLNSIKVTVTKQLIII